MHILGIDIGGSGIKGGVVDTQAGELITERFRIPTPTPSSPHGVAQAVSQVANQFDWKGQIGCGFPAIIQHGVARSAANIDPDWIGVNVADLFTQTTSCPTTVINDADAAGLAEIIFGAGKDRSGTVLVITIGTGLGTALFVDGLLVPNMELGHIEIRGKDAELRASDAARKRKKMSWKKWATRFDEYLRCLESLINPDLIILGGGASKDLGHFQEYLTLQTAVVPAQFFNEAGIIGAALAAQRQPPTGQTV